MSTSDGAHSWASLRHVRESALGVCVILRVTKKKVQIPALTLSICVSLGRCLSVSEPLFPHLKNGDNVSAQGFFGIAPTKGAQMSNP